MFANFPKPLYVTDCFEYSISLDFVVLKFLLECLLFCSHNLWLPEQQTFLISDWQVPTMITGIFFYLFNSNALKFPSSFCCYSANLFLSFLALFHVFLLFFFSSFLFCSLFFLLSQHHFVTVQRLQRWKASSLHSHKIVSVKHCMLLPNQILQP